MNIYIFLPLLVALVFAKLDASLASLFINVVILGVGCSYIFRIPSKYRNDAFKLLVYTYTIYLTTAYIYSLSFHNGAYFYSGDSSKYLSLYLNNKNFDVSLESMFATYLDSKDILYHQYLRFFSYFGNVFLGGSSVYYMTLLQTLFGVLSALVLYKLLIKIVGKDALKYALCFSVFSLFIIYSNFVVRDIIIAYLYLEAILILTNRFKISKVLILLILVIVTLGIRIQSGIFLVRFILIYIYNKLYNTKYRSVTNFVFIIIGIISAYFLFSSVYYTDYMEDMDNRKNETADRVAENSGLFSVFSKLPIGVRQVALLLYTQICPFPPYYYLMSADNFSQILISVNVIISEIYWYFVSYTLLFSIFLKKIYRVFTTSELFLLILAMVFILLLSVQPDIRRMMPVYPIIYILYVKSIKILPKKWNSMVKGRLFLIYVSLLFVYLLIKGV